MWTGNSWWSKGKPWMDHLTERIQVRGSWDFVSVPFFFLLSLLFFFFFFALQHVTAFGALFFVLPLTNYSFERVALKAEIDRVLGFEICYTLLRPHRKQSGTSLRGFAGKETRRYLHAKPCNIGNMISSIWRKGVVRFCQIAGYRLSSAIGYRLYSARPKDGYNWPKAATIYQRRLPFVLTTNIVDTVDIWAVDQERNGARVLVWVCSTPWLLAICSWHEACWFRTLQLVKPAKAVATSHILDTLWNYLFNNRTASHGKWKWSAIVVSCYSMLQPLIVHENAATSQNLLRFNYVHGQNTLPLAIGKA